MANYTSQHILNTSANLLGFCLIVITSLHIANKAETTVIDQLTSGISILLTCSCICSFMALKTKDPAREKRLEKAAEYIFLSSLVGILVIILLIVLNFAK